MTRIAYVVHDLNDAAVARRVRMLRAAGGDPVVMGFRRSDKVPAMIEGASVVDLGRTADSRLLQRAMAVIGNLLRPRIMLEAARGAEVIIGRNLEALILAARIRTSLPDARLIYECLDIHRTLLGSAMPHRAIQSVEGRLLRQIDLLIVSSPAFMRDYFARRAMLKAPALLMENKVLALDGPAATATPPPPGPPWTIGWLGNLRCRKTFDILTALAARHEGRIKILIAGRATTAVFEDFEGDVRAAPHCTYLGPYRPDDLPGIYAQCHFAWAIDFFEEGLNSSWLLPNRLYEASAFGTVPIALGSVETGHWLAQHDAGVLIADMNAALDAILMGMNREAYTALRRKVADIPPQHLFATQDDCQQLMDAIRPG